MNTKERVETIAQMAKQKAVQLTQSWQEWTAFLTTASRLYKYPYHEQIMIYAQRPNATACAEYDLWNNKMGRYVRRGSKGIALLDDSGANPRLRYVFDVSDTGTREQSRHVKLWEYRPEHDKAISDMLERRYHISGEDGLADKLERTAARLAGEYWNDHQQDILGIVDNSLLCGYDDFNVGVAFRNAATVSITYALMSRCGLETEHYFQHEDFMQIFDFNTPEAVAELGTAVSNINQEVLRQIEVTIKNYEREHHAERTAQHGEQPDLHEERRLSDPQHGPERAAGEALGQVRQDAESVSAGTQTGTLQPPAVERETVSALSGDRGIGEPASGRDDAPAGEGSRSNGGTEGQRLDEVGGSDEHLQSSGRGDHYGGIGVRLIPSEDSGQFSLFPSEGEQIAYIEKAESETLSAFSFAQKDIDQVLRYGGNTERLREIVTVEYEKQKSTEQIAAYLKTVYHGYDGILTDHGRISAWYADDGIHLSYTKAAQYDKSAQIISWETAAKRIEQLLDAGQYATNVELVEASDYERKQLAEKLWHLSRDFTEKGRGYLPSLREGLHGGFPTETALLSQQLTDSEFRDKLSAEYVEFLTAYKKNRDILGLHYHRVDNIAARLADLNLPRRHYETDMLSPPHAKFYITEDELDAAIAKGSGIAGGHYRIYEFFQAGHTAQEKAEFLKHEYGTGGRSNALSANLMSWEEHDSTGEKFRKPDCPDVKLSWGKVASRITDLIRKDRYLTVEELQSYRERQEEQSFADSPAPETLPQGTEITTQTPMASDDFIHHYYVVEDLKVQGPLALTNYHTLPEALDAYFALPDSVTKALGAQNTKAPLPGSLDFLQCISGRDKILDDYLKVDGWDCCTGIIKQLEESIADHVRKEDTLDPEYSPWGEVDSCSFLQTGVFEVSTPSHGGVMIDSRYENEILSPAAQRIGFQWGGYHCYEEDCEAMVAIRELIDKGIFTPPVNDYYKDGEYEKTINHSIQEWYPEYWQEREKALSHSVNPMQEDIDYAKDHLIPGETTFEWDGRTFMVDRVNNDSGTVNLQDITFAQNTGFPISRTEPISTVRRYLETQPVEQEKEVVSKPKIMAENFHITDAHLGEGGPKAKFQDNLSAIQLLKDLEAADLQATPDQQQVLSRYVGWGGLANAFDPSKDTWAKEYQQLQEILTPEEYDAARASTLNAHYTSPTVIKAIYEAVGRMGFETGNILEPSCGVGNFFGMLPEQMQNSRLYGVELDSISGRIAQRLYPKADITVAGFEKTDRRDFFDLAIGNVPFGQYKVNDKAYNKLNFNIHNYFFGATRS